MTAFEFGKWLHEHGTSLSEVREEYDAHHKRMVEAGLCRPEDIPPFNAHLAFQLKHWPTSALRGCFPFAESKQGRSFWLSLDRAWGEYYKELIKEQE